MKSYLLGALLLLAACSAEVSKSGEPAQSSSARSSASSSAATNGSGSEVSSSSSGCMAYNQTAGDGGAGTWMCGGDLAAYGCVPVSWCQRGTEYCLIESRPGELDSSCVPVPSQCTGDPACTCSVVSDCVVVPDGGAMAAQLQ